MKTYEIKLNERQLQKIIAGLTGLPSLENEKQIIQLQMMESDTIEKLGRIQAKLGQKMVQEQNLVKPVTAEHNIQTENIVN